MTRVKLELQTISIPEKIRKARQVIDQLTGNPNFPGTATLIADLKGHTDSLEKDDDTIKIRNAAAIPSPKSHRKCPPCNQNHFLRVVGSGGTILQCEMEHDAT